MAGTPRPSGVKLSIQIPIVMGYGLVSLIALADKKAIARKERLALMVKEPHISEAELAKIQAPTLVISRNKRYDPSKGDRADPAVHSGQPAYDPSGKSFSYIRTAGVVQPDGGEISGREQKDVKRRSVQALQNRGVWRSMKMEQKRRGEAMKKVKIIADQYL